jgi:predicted PurR-regulated permease PerM
VTPLVMFYLLVDWHPMLTRIGELLPRDHATTVKRLASDINDAVAAFIRGQGTICLVLGCLYAIGLSLAGVNYGALVGLTTGILTFIPIVGWVLGLVTALGLTLAQFGADPIILAKVAAVLVAGLMLDTAVLSPQFVGQKVGLHPVWLIFSLFAFSYLFGFVGTLVAVPVAAALGVLVRHALSLYLESSVYKGQSSLGPP